jgi:hypothetical protein
MAPTELDKRIREIMEKRKISPSRGSWEKLSGELPVKRQSRRAIIWGYGIAATLAGLLLLSAFLIRSYREAPQAVTKTGIPGQEKQISDPVPADRLPPGDNVAGIAAEEAGLDVRASVAQTGGKGKTHKVAAEGELRKQETVHKENATPLPVSEISGTYNYIEEKAAEVAARVAVIEASEGEVTAAEVEALLRAAQEEIVKNSNRTDLKPVDPMALLSEAESNLDKSFRDQIFEKLKTGYEKVRTAVADRNN